MRSGVSCACLNLILQREKCDLNHKAQKSSFSLFLQYCSIWKTKDYVQEQVKTNMVGKDRLL